jgi:hypothetical protein
VLQHLVAHGLDYGQAPFNGFLLEEGHCAFRIFTSRTLM